MAVRVVIVDDDDGLRTLLRTALTLHGGFEVVAEAADGQSAIDAVELGQPDIVVLDVGLPDLSGIDVLPQLGVVAPSARIVIFTGSDGDDGLEAESLRRGATAYIVKDGLDYLVDLLVDLGRLASHSAALSLDALPESAGRARRFADDYCRLTGCELLGDEVTLIVSELVTNAVVHAATACELRMRWTGHVLRLEVLDRSTVMPDVRRATDDDEGGRGLELIGALASSWGVEAASDGAKVVWAELLYPH